MTGDKATRFGTVALIGPSNVGKSTLVNRLVGGKVAIVTPRKQTTRTTILGIMVRDGAQLALFDSPGIFQPASRLDRSMVAAAWAGAAAADRVMVLAEAQAGRGRGVLGAVADGLRRRGLRASLIINKIDLVGKPTLLARAEALTKLFDFEEVFMVSAADGDGVEDIADSLAAKAPAGPWQYPEDELTDVPMRQFAAEITREKAFELLRDELPYALAVETEQYAEREGRIEIGQVIHVSRSSQKGIVLGRQGAMIKRIGTEARRELQEILERPVRLDLFVRVTAGWSEDGERLRALGIEPDVR